MGYEDDDFYEPWESFDHSRSPRNTSASNSPRDLYDDFRDRVRIVQAANPKPSVAPRTNTTATKVTRILNGVRENDLLDIASSKFLGTYLDRTGKCFSTEVRDSGIYICGAHKEVWANATPEMKDKVCPHVAALVTDVIESLKSSANAVHRKSSGTTYAKRQKMVTFDDYEDYDGYP